MWVVGIQARACTLLGKRGTDSFFARAKKASVPGLRCIARFAESQSPFCGVYRRWVEAYSSTAGGMPSGWPPNASSRRMVEDDTGNAT